MGRLFNGKARLGKVILQRAGEIVEVLEPDSPSENKYGKVEDDERTYTVIGEERARRVYDNLDTRPGEADVSGGRLRAENPRILFQKDAIVDEDHRVRFPDSHEYVLDEEVPLDTHTSFRVTYVNG